MLSVPKLVPSPRKEENISVSKHMPPEQKDRDLISYLMKQLHCCKVRMQFSARLHGISVAGSCPDVTLYTSHTENIYSSKSLGV